MKSYLELIKIIFDELNFYKKDFGVHFHSSPENSYSKIEVAYKSGCKRFDSTISGIGGCPFAKDELVGNISTQTLLNFIQKNNIKHKINEYSINEFTKAVQNCIDNGLTNKKLSFSSAILAYFMYRFKN